MQQLKGEESTVVHNVLVNTTWKIALTYYENAAESTHQQLPLKSHSVPMRYHHHCGYHSEQ